MSRMKDEYIRLLEAEWADLEDQGIPSDKAYELAGERAYFKLRDRLTDWGRPGPTEEDQNG